jgi:hypothetical protein
MSPEESKRIDVEIVRLRQQGLTQAAVGEKLGRSMQAIAQRIYACLLLVLQRLRHSVSDLQPPGIWVELLADGYRREVHVPVGLLVNEERMYQLAKGRSLTGFDTMAGMRVGSAGAGRQPAAWAGGGWVGLLRLGEGFLVRLAGPSEASLLPVPWAADARVGASQPSGSGSPCHGFTPHGR